MESKKIEAIFKDYITKENTNYALLITGKWGSGKTFLWKSLLEKNAIENKFKPIYVSLNGISNIREIEGILLSKILPFSDALENEFVKSSLKFVRNGVNLLGNVFGGGTQLSDLTKGVDLNLDLSNVVLCFDDLERCSIPIKEILGFLNDYTEHKNIKVIICADEEEIKDKDYSDVKEKLIRRTLSFNANYDEVLDDYISKIENQDFKEFMNNKKKIIVHYFKKYDIQNLRTLGFYLENISRLFDFYKNENDLTTDNMVFFTLIISNEFKTGKLSISNLNDKQGIDEYLLFINIEDIVGSFSGFQSNTNEKEVKEKSYSEVFSEKYLVEQNEKNMYLFSEAIYEYVLSGYLDENKLKNEIDKINGKGNETKEQKAYTNLMGYNFRMLENDVLEATINEVLEYAEQGKYDMYSYQSVFNNLLYHVKNGSIAITEEELKARLIKGVEIASNKTEVNDTQILHMTHFTYEKDFNTLERKISDLHFEKKDKLKNESANKIFELIENEQVEVNDFFTNELINNYSLFQYIDVNKFYDKLILLKNKNLLIFSNALQDVYLKGYIQYPEKELPFFQELHIFLEYFFKENDLKNPQKTLIEELLEIIIKIISKFSEMIDRNEHGGLNTV